MDQIIKSKNAKNGKERKCLTTTKKSVKSHSTAQHSTALTSFFSFFRKNLTLTDKNINYRHAGGIFIPKILHGDFLRSKNFQKEEIS